MAGLFERAEVIFLAAMGLLGAVDHGQAREFCKKQDKEGYWCETGHCCGDGGCCTYYYELWWFWLIWILIIVLCCCCIYQRYKVRRRQERQRRQREINLLIAQQASLLHAPPLNLDAILKLPSYQEAITQQVDTSPPPRYTPTLHRADRPQLPVSQIRPAQVTVTIEGGNTQTVTTNLHTGGPLPLSPVSGSPDARTPVSIFSDCRTPSILDSSPSSCIVDTVEEKAGIPDDTPLLGACGDIPDPPTGTNNQVETCAIVSTANNGGTAPGIVAATRPTSTPDRSDVVDTSPESMQSSAGDGNMADSCNRQAGGR
ncbi:WW domain-binding protein 1-like [Branchiostoma floridae]|uniref:WW domain-binding protein 1-like n=1 Tax=Branchiostoma floridae TaxID=7739 RepID=A0A9J7MMM0_BRAFL|nr:WW domain-binding protein 1-like [Branchiostoma floridae]